MIAKLTGLIDAATAEGVVLDVNGVGYLVFCSPRTLARLPAKGAPASLLIETHVREDHIHLYGFADVAERDWFRLLTTVQGVGAKLAQAVLGVLSPDDLARAIAAGAGGGDEDLEIGAKLLLADEILDRLRSQGRIGPILRHRLGCHHARRRRHWLSSLRPALIS